MPISPSQDITGLSSQNPFEFARTRWLCSGSFSISPLFVSFGYPDWHEQRSCNAAPILPACVRPWTKSWDQMRARLNRLLETDHCKRARPKEWVAQARSSSFV
jgi:hypothetical protein